MPDRRLTRSRKPFARHLRARGLTFAAAALRLTQAGCEVTASRLGMIARGAEPSPGLAREIQRVLGFPARRLIKL